MFVVLAYDISSKKRAKIEKICEKYLHHIQKSVFEGEISFSDLNRIKNIISNLIDTNTDNVVLYRSEKPGETLKEVIGNQPKNHKNNINKKIEYANTVKI